MPRSRPPRRRPSAPTTPLLFWETIVAAVLLGSVVGFAGWRLLRPAAPPSPHPHGSLSAAAARAANAAIGFAPGPLRHAAPFRFRGTPAAREQAIRCLATAALYEAGADPDGQRAVMQVVLNRVRRPAFPKTVCGVVYQGATRATGCQFSFTCDHSLARRPETRGWAAARLRAAQALAGAVYRPVGTATHYHADYVLPYWQGTLDKIAVVHAHIFYRPHS